MIKKVDCEFIMIIMVDWVIIILYDICELVFALHDHMIIKGDRVIKYSKIDQI